MIFLDTNVVSETFRHTPDPSVIAWLTSHDAELALPTVTIGEIAFGIAKIPPDQRARRLARNLDEWRRRFSGRIFAFNEDAALAFGGIMGDAIRRGRPMSTADGMIAAIAKVGKGRLATRNVTDFEGTGVELICPWSP
ncbi:type II toxin-antitoxin system VapC family toxin [Zavarzinia sp.]|uniref:type II toxin-antitoxin system VapC family toxin n=1 Tax=Zavarzinia sp. TaxID=2027920 RepID=UPI003BB671BA|nr:type II toxin-antitoxin system VapC family toxin [Zavarzinia sp.]